MDLIFEWPLRPHGETKTVLLNSTAMITERAERANTERKLQQTLQLYLQLLADCATLSTLRSHLGELKEQVGALPTRDDCLPR
jgi:hypothetical protein